MIISCGCVIENNNKYLVIRQCNLDYGFPKGHIEDHETYMECALRETKEETNLDVNIIESISKEIIYKTKYGKKKVILYYSITDSSDVVIQESEILEYKWCDYEEVIKLLSFKATINMFEQLVRKYNKNYKRGGRLC
jgi:tRNA nucleotidyltransferase (CCA-adding enzyme)